MRRHLARARDRITCFLRESAWAPLVGRALGVVAGMALLAAIGAGWLDRQLDLGPPRAEAATSPRRDAVRPPRDRGAAAAAPDASAPSHDAPAPRPAPPAAASANGSGAPAPPPPPPEAAPSPTTPDGKVILNAAGERDLDRLPGVGPARARAIVALREKLGGKFRRFEDLLRVRGIGRRSLERIRANAVLDPPPPPEVITPPGG